MFVLFLHYSLISFIVITILGLGYFSLASYFEREYQAFGRSLLLSIALTPFLYLLIRIPENMYLIIDIIPFIIIVLSFFYIVYPGKFRLYEKRIPLHRQDERDTMFSRFSLEENTERFDNYYKNHPDLKTIDDTIRRKPGLLSENSRYYDARIFAAAAANFTAVNQFHTLANSKDKNNVIKDISAEQIKEYLQIWANDLGIHSIGFTELKKEHLYHTGGRGARYDKMISSEHKSAIAFTVEMDKDYVDTAPLAPTVLESSNKYLLSGNIAVQIAQFIRNLGYEAQAHIDGNYLLICPLVARDAGLGDIGRMGLLMTPDLGPRVRIAVVTTTLKLPIDKKNENSAMLNFCTICKKCAENCPGKAIPNDEQKIQQGVQRWKIDAEACYSYWCDAGTDCARCMMVCPYSHPNTIIHKLVRFGLNTFPNFHKPALLMDNFFYGKKPSPKPLNS